MNTTISNLTREKIKEGLCELPESWQNMFKRIYHHIATDCSLNELVDKLPVENLDMALTQVENSLNKLDIK